MQIKNSGTSLILIVDDHRDSARAVAKLLSFEGYPTKIACTCSEAIQLATTAPLSLLLCDISLTDGDGCELLARIRQIHPMVPAISVSGYQSDKDMQRYAEAGFNLNLSKPVDFSTLCKAVENVLATRCEVNVLSSDAANVGSLTLIGHQ